jgi:hypothetical protein
MQAVNVWLASPNNLVKEYKKSYLSDIKNPDCYGNKALVLDLAFYHKAGAKLEWQEERRDAFHYQRLVELLPPGQKREISFNLSKYIEEARQAIPTLAPIEDLRLHQLEYLIEVKDAEGEATITKFQLEY